jgi:hypothetical protein
MFSAGTWKRDTAQVISDHKFSTVISDHFSLIEKASSLPVTSSDQVDILI